jgi:Tfp pilus assembly protein PilW
MRQALRHLIRDERGTFTLMELVAAIPAGLCVLGAAGAMTITFIRTEHASFNRDDVVERAQTGMERMAREIRQASQFTLVSSNVLQISTWVVPSGGGARVPWDVRYDCSAGQTCRRLLQNSDATWPATSTGNPVLTGVTNTTVFSATGTRYVGISVLLSVPGASRTVTVTDGVGLQN